MQRVSTDAKIAALLAIAVALVFSDVLFFGSGFYIRDIYRDYLPSRFILRAVLAGGEFPMWNRFWSAGQPLAANPGFQAFYPGTWLVFLPSFFFGFNLEIVAHIALATIGMFLLLRSMQLRVASALFGAIAFGFGGVILSLTNLLPFLTSVAWWPLIVMFARQRRFGALAFALGMLFLAAEQSVIVQTAILLICWTRRRAALVSIALALGIAAVQLIPAADLMRDSNRAHSLTFEDGTSWSMPLIRPAELFYPFAFGRITDDGAGYRGSWRYRPPRLPLIFSIYCGLLVPLLAVAGIAMRLQRWTWFAIPLSYLLAIGSNGPLPVFYRWIRYPEKFILFGLFAMIVLAAAAFDRLDRRFAPFLLLLTVGDLALHVNDLAPRMPRRFFTPPPVTLALTDARGPTRIFHEAEWPVWGTRGIALESGARTYWSQRTALMPFTPALYGLQTIYEIDINVTSLRPTAELVQSMWEALGNRAPVRPFMLMGNAEYLVLPGRPIRIARGATLPRYWFADQLVSIGRREDFVRDLTTKRWSDRAAFVTMPAFAPARAEVLRVTESANRADIAVRAEGQAFLVASVTPHRYWNATIDGAPAPLQTANVGFQGVIVPAGTHTIRFRYGNPLFAIFGAISIISFLLVIIMMIYHDY
ncbi:MAG: YfhO family protein [Acidobacteriota bacterium]|nr:YfhO family protein [Acidobacteriota bacterium]